MLAVYGLITQQDIGKLFIAGILPGILAIAMYMYHHHHGDSDGAPELSAGGHAQLAGASALHALRDVWAMTLLFVLRHRRIYGGWFTATEAAGMGAAGALIIGLAAAPVSAGRIAALACSSRLRTTAPIFTILIGAYPVRLFPDRYANAAESDRIADRARPRPLRHAHLIMLMYLVLGCLMDAMAMIILTVPIIFPVINALGFDPIWFGVIIVMTVELGLIHPPVGMNMFVIKSVVKDVKISTIFYGVMPFIVTDLVRLVILIAFPIIALWLPQQM